MSAFYSFDLKSNMDRFIENSNKSTIECMRHLKSNMDRFIELQML